MWWKGVGIFFGCIGTMVLAVMMILHIGSETDPWAIFWFLVFAAASGVLILLFGDKDFLGTQSQQQPRVRIVFREHQRPKQPKPIPMNLKK